MTRRPPHPLPDGFRYQPDFLSPDEEAQLIDEMQRMAFGAVEMRGQVAKRRAAHFGLLYDYASFKVAPGPPVPDFLRPVRERAAEWAGVSADDFAEVLVQEYPPGAVIGWHRDAPAFGLVAGVSLRAPCEFRFRLKEDGGWRRATLEVAPRSVYVLDGDARTRWQHSIPPTKDLRYSITLRTLRKRQ